MKMFFDYAIPMTNIYKKYFGYNHLPPNLQEISKLFSDLAETLDKVIPDNDQKNVGYQKLLEAKDCFVRANLPD